MSFLGDLFDPSGFLSGNFSPGQGIEGILNPAGPAANDLGLTPDWLNNAQDTASNFVDNNVDVLGSQLEDFGNKFKKNPAQLLFGAGDPLATKAWNGITGQNETPYVDQFGGMTPESWRNAQSRGINTEDAGYMSQLAHMISGSAAGSWAGGVAGSALQVGAEAPAGSSALSDAVGQTSGGGFGSSQTAYDASQIPGWAGGGGGAYGSAVRGGVSGGVQGSGNALDSNQNIFQGFASGAGQGALSSGGNMDFAGTFGIDDPRLKSVINGALGGAGRAAVQGQNPTQGAAVGGFGGLGSNFDMGSLAAGLGQMYLGYQGAKGINGQISNLNSLYAPNSPYAQQMQQALERQDAASGRRSQYGTRAVELQARLADAASRNAPTLSNLYGQQRMNRFGTAAGAFQMARSNGLFNPSTYQGFWNQPQGSMPPQINDQMTPYQIPQGQLDSDVSATIPDLSSMFGGG